MSIRQVSTYLGHASLALMLVILHVTEISESRGREVQERLLHYAWKAKWTSHRSCASTGLDMWSELRPHAVRSARFPQQDPWLRTAARFDHHGNVNRPSKSNALSGSSPGAAV